MRRAPAIFAAVSLAAGVIAAILLRGTTDRHRAVRHAAEESSLVGELVAYDAPTRRLVLRTPDGDETFTVAPRAIVHEGPTDRTDADLASVEGRVIKIWYRRTPGGVKRVQSLRVASGAFGNTIPSPPAVPQK